MHGTQEKINNLKIVNHPVIGENLAILRNKNSDGERFRAAANRIAQILFYEAAKGLPVIEKTIETPLETMKQTVIDNTAEIIVSPILRAGLAFEKCALELLPVAKVCHIGMYRNEETLKPVWYYNKLPKNFKNPQKTFVFITDPMLATGGSLLDAIKLFADRNIPQKNIKAVCLIGAPEGVNKVHSHYPDVEITLAALDRTLNEKGYILPGLGDAGDRLFNTL